MSTNNFEKLLLLLWKDWLLQSSHKQQLLMQILFPAAISLLFLYIRLKSETVTENLVIYNETFPLNNLQMLEDNLYDHNISFHLAYSPNTNSALNDIVKEASKSLKLSNSGYANARDMQNVLSQQNYLGGIEFDDSLANQDEAPLHLNYNIRFPSNLRTGENMFWQTNNIYLRRSRDPFGPRNLNDEDGGIPVGYLREGFLSVQNAISTAFLRQLSKKSAPSLPEINLRRYPYPEFTKDQLLQLIEIFMPLLFYISFMYSATNMIKFITEEKEKQLKEVMKMMGLANWLHWTAWFLQGFLIMGSSMLIVAIILVNKWSDGVQVLPNSCFTAVLFFFLVYTAATVTFCLMVSTFFSKANTAASVSGMIWSFTIIPHIYFSNLPEASLSVRLGWCLLCNTGMGLGIELISEHEFHGYGLRWSTIFTRINPDEPITMGHVMGVMVFSCFLNLAICLYVEQIYPGEFGVPKKWNFPFTKTFWYGGRGAKHMENEDSHSSSRGTNANSFEAEPVGKRIGLEVKGLSKSFHRLKAVKGVSMNMYEDQITVLLGHNGAGKTTTISMLTGMYPPTSGTAILNGYDIRTNINGARASLGVCPQQNILFDDLTVKQHLIFYSRLKGLKGNALQTEVNGYLRKIELENKANVASSELSGGMKRKLSVCAAFCGGSKIVMCDEPSSGMDPAARRQLWDVMQSEKTGRTILLTTHFMDEADVLGDRIAIMVAGELKCMGTPFFLKKTFGSGYLLVCVKKKNCDVSRVTELLRRYIPGLKPESNIGAELSYQLPDRYSSEFERMFHDIENKSDELLLNGFGISITSLEEVFLKVGAEEVTNTEKTENNNQNGYQALNGISESLSDKHLLKGLRLTVNQWRAMIMKKFRYFVGSPLLFIIQNFLPLLFLISSNNNAFSSSSSSISELKPMTVQMYQYPETVTVLETTSNVKPQSLEWDISEHYKDIVNEYGSSHKLLDIGKEPFIDYMLKLGQTQQANINSKYIAAATVDDKQITAWLNNEPLHSAPLTLNLIHNAMARSLIGEGASISVTNAPLHFEGRQSSTPSNKISNSKISNYFTSCLIGFSMCVVSAFYVVPIIKERESRAKLLQFVSGAKVWTFWLTHLLWDYLTLMITSIVVIITLYYLQKDGFSTFDQLVRIFILLLLFGLAALPMTYMMSYSFADASTGLTRLPTVNIIFGVGLFVVSSGLREWKNIDKYEKYFLAFPHFSLTLGAFKLCQNFNQRQNCELMADTNCLDELTPYFASEYPGVFLEAVSFIATGILYFAMVLLRDYRCFDMVSYKLYEMIRKPPPRGSNIDEDVEEEKKRVENMSLLEISSHNLVLDKFSKFYGSFLAVNQISVGVKQSECFGLLGVNGAGKTTMFKMLTGDQRIFLGKAYVKGMSLRTKMRKVEKEIGYCPQFDALFDDLTGQENLKLFGLLRGIPADRIPAVSWELAKSFGFTQHYDKPVGTYSGGNKRKVSAAVAIMGGPSVLYLDEPTTGIDPAARRHLWNVLCEYRDSGKTIILTSHSMEECEALCTRLAIMVNGEFKCLGSTQHLKNRFSKGLVLKLKMKKNPDNKLMGPEENAVKSITDFINKEFPKAELQERFQQFLTFYIPLSSTSWSRIFGLMERNKDNLKIEDYSISQTSLEQIFLQFAQDQRNDPRDHKKKFFAFLNCKK